MVAFFFACSRSDLPARERRPVRFHLHHCNEAIPLAAVVAATE